MIQPEFKRIVAVHHRPAWLPPHAEVATALTRRLPRTDLITSVHALCFDEGGRLLTVTHEKRGEDIPGGHLEKGETPLQALIRELAEEAKVAITDPQVIARLQVTLHGERPENYKYPYPRSFMIVYAARIGRLDSFVQDCETVARTFIEPDKAHTIAWVREHPVLYENAFKVATGRYIAIGSRTIGSRTP